MKEELGEQANDRSNHTLLARTPRGRCGNDSAQRRSRFRLDIPCLSPRKTYRVACLWTVIGSSSRRHGTLFDFTCHLHSLQPRWLAPVEACPCPPPANLPGPFCCHHGTVAGDRRYADRGLVGQPPARRRGGPPMSPNGTKLPSGDVRGVVAIEGKADIRRAARNRRD
jgi:hypothetical protein